MESDFAYFTRRAAEEHRAAASAQSAAARAAHYELAGRHRRMAELLRQPAPFIGIRVGRRPVPGHALPMQAMELRQG